MTDYAELVLRRINRLFLGEGRRSHHCGFLYCRRVAAAGSVTHIVARTD
jgi:hypothetical protein